MNIQYINASHFIYRPLLLAAWYLLILMSLDDVPAVSNWLNGVRMYVIREKGLIPL